MQHSNIRESTFLSSFEDTMQSSFTIGLWRYSRLLKKGQCSAWEQSRVQCSSGIRPPHPEIDQFDRWESVWHYFAWKFVKNQKVMLKHLITRKDQDDGKKSRNIIEFVLVAGCRRWSEMLRYDLWPVLSVVLFSGIPGSADYDSSLLRRLCCLTLCTNDDKYTEHFTVTATAKV